MTTSRPSDSERTAPANAGRWSYSRSDRSRRNGPLRRAFRTARRRVLGPLVPALAPLALRGVARTWRVTSTAGERRDDVLQGPDGCIAVLWHGRMAAAAPLFKGVDATILVSRSGDGELARMMLRRLGYRTIRGSTGKVGSGALRELREVLGRGGVIAITPDGPRGPRHHVNRGAAFLARATGRPILPIGFAAARARRLSSWDRFLVPLPFSRVHICYGEPLRVDGELPDDHLDRIGAELRERLIGAESVAAAALGIEVDW